jgi:hypothetical protein
MIEQNTPKPKLGEANGKLLFIKMAKGWLPRQAGRGVWSVCMYGGKKQNCPIDDEGLRFVIAIEGESE